MYDTILYLLYKGFQIHREQICLLQIIHKRTIRVAVLSSLFSTESCSNDFLFYSISIEEWISLLYPDTWNVMTCSILEVGPCDYQSVCLFGE